MAYTTIWGVDIGNSVIKAVKMERHKDTAIIIGFDMIAVEHTDDDSEHADNVSMALARLVANHEEMRKTPVFISIPGNLCFFKDFMLPPGIGDKLDDLVKLEAQQQIPMGLDQVYWGYLDFEAEGETGVQLIAVRREEIDSILSMIDRHKINVRGIGVAPISLFNMVHFEYSPEGPCVILDAGARGTDFVVMSGRQVFFRNIPIAGAEYTRVIAHQTGRDFIAAEKIKRNIGKSKQKDSLLKAIFPTMRSMASDIQRSIGFYKSKNRGAQIQMVYTIGHTFSIPTMLDTLKKQIRDGEKVQVKSLNKIEVGNVNEKVFKRELPALAVALGLGLQGLGLGELDVNLVPEERIEREKRGAQQLSLGVASLFLLVAAILYALSGIRQAAASQREKAALDDLGKKVQDSEGEYKRQIQRGDDSERPISIEMKKSLSERLLRIANDRRKIKTVYETVMSLNPIIRNLDDSDKKDFLTAVYVSRIPPTADSDLGGPVEHVGSNVDRTNLDHNIKLNRFYRAFALEGDYRQWVPLELRSELPMFCVISLESYAERAKVTRRKEEIKKELVRIGLVADPESGMLIKDDVEFRLFREGADPIAELRQKIISGDVKLTIIKAGDKVDSSQFSLNVEKIESSGESIVFTIQIKVGDKTERKRISLPAGKLVEKVLAFSVEDVVNNVISIIRPRKPVKELKKEKREVIDDMGMVYTRGAAKMKKYMEKEHKNVSRFNILFRVYERPDTPVDLPDTKPKNISKSLSDEKWARMAFSSADASRSRADYEKMLKENPDPAKLAAALEEWSFNKARAEWYKAQYNRLFGIDVFQKYDIPGVRTTVQNIKEGWLPETLGKTEAGNN